MADTDKERWRLSRLYGSMTEGEVEKLAADAGSLSDAAKWALKLDLSRRGLKTRLEVPGPPVQAAKLSKVVNLRQYMTLPEALLAKSILESAGIESFLGDQNIIRMDWFLSNALGGVKLRVREEDVEVATALLDRSRADLSED
jgi:Putative prokaryotic signal transducing protein